MLIPLSMDLNVEKGVEQEWEGGAVHTQRAVQNTEEVIFYLSLTRYCEILIMKPLRLGSGPNSAAK